MKVMKYRDVEEKKPDMEGAEGVTVRWLISGKDGAPNFYMRRFEVKGHTPHHNHPFEHEIYILSGEGVVLEGETEHPVGPGTFCYIPPGETHQIQNRGEEPLQLLCLIPRIDGK